MNDKQIRSDQLAKREDKRDLPTEEINIGDTVKLRNNNDKHKASEIYLVTNKDKENVTVQKLLHPLKNTPTMIMSKTYKTKSKLLKKIHQARQPEYADVIEDDQTRQTRELKKRQTPWNPFDPQFFDNSDSENEEDDVTRKKQTHSTSTKIIPIPDANNQEIEWDDSPELIQLQEPTSTPETTPQDPMLPRRLFEDHAETNQSSNERTIPKLKRRNAIRRKWNPVMNAQSEEMPRRISQIPRKIRSNPTTPREVQLDQVNNLNAVLKPRTPITPHAVQLDSVQRLDEALSQASPQRRRSARILAQEERQGKKTINYMEFNRRGWRD